MMEFIMVPLVVGIVTLGIYKLFELFVKRRERLNIIEKIGDKVDVSAYNEMFDIPIKFKGKFSFGALKAGCLLCGIGLGLLVAYFIVSNVYTDWTDIFNHHGSRQLVSMVTGASVLLFGGLSLLIAFFIEMKYMNKNK